MQKQAAVDYLQYNIIEPLFDVTVAAPIAPVRNYARGVLNTATGERAYYGNVNSDRWLVIVSGEGMQNIRSTRGEHGYITQVLHEGGRVTRLDLALDCFVGDDLITTDDVIEWHKAGKLDSSHSKYGAKTVYNADTEHHETVYIGDMKKRAKKGIFRAYDKGYEQLGIENIWTRFEIEYKREQAHTNTRRLMNQSIESVFAAKVAIDDERWQRFLQAEPAHLSRERNNLIMNNATDNESTWHWLFTQVAPALGRAIGSDILNGETKNYEYFNVAVRLAYEEHVKKHEHGETSIGQVDRAG